jgi:dTDP-4-dehydrorhamnose 3,5-epimerase
MSINCPEIFDKVYVFDLNIHKDNRGILFENYRSDKKLTEIKFCQENIVISKFGVLRGLHFQKEPYAQSKLITVIKGEIQDVIVDLRKNSKTFGDTSSIILSEKEGKQLFIPKGFAHGFLTLSEQSIVQYKVDNYYSPNNQSAIAYDDKELDIKWKLGSKDIILSQNDIQNNSFANTTYFK